MPAQKNDIDVVIASGASLTTGVFIPHAVPVGIQIPVAWTTGGLAFQASGDATGVIASATFVTLTGYSFSAGVIPASGGVFIPLNRDQFRGANWIKIRSGTNGTPVNQGAARTLKLILESGYERI